MTLSALELYRRGRAHLNAGRAAAARGALLRAQGRTDDPDLLARIDGALAAVIIRQGDSALAERMCHDALARPGVSSHTTAVLHGQLGLLALERGDLDVAVAFLEEGVEGVGDDRDYRPMMLFNRSVAHMQRGDLVAAAADLDAAAADYAIMGDDVQRAMAENNSGYVALLSGDLISALASIGRARAVMEKTSAVNTAICELDRAEVLREAGMSTDAERSLGRVARVFAAHRMPQARGEAEYHRARALLTIAPNRAATAASQALRTFNRAGSTWWALRADAVRLRALLAADLEDSPSRARPPSAQEVDVLVRELENRRLRADEASLRLSWELWRAVRTPSGAVGAPVRTPRDAPIQVRLLAHEVRTARSTARRDHRSARHHAAAGLDELAEWQSAFGSLDLATSLTLHGSGLMFAGLRAAAQSSKPDVFFDWAERARHLAQQSVPLRPPPDPEMAAELAELRIMRAEAGSEDWLADPRAGALSERVRERQWTGTEAAGALRRLSLGDMHDALDDGTALVTYVFDGAGLFALAVTAGSAKIFRLGDWKPIASALAGLRADLDMAALVRSGPMASAVATALESRLAMLSRVVVEPLLPFAGDRRLVLTVPGVLGGLPWGMLPALRGRVFTLATSASQWADRPPPGPRRSVGLVAGPRVARAEEEVAGARAAWRAAETTTGAAATVDAVTALASRVDVLHVAAHGRHSPEHPLFSGLELADGTLFGYDIDLIAEVPDLVVMSSCEVGRSASRGGEEAIGMTRIWLHAGTSCVVAAPVVVADDVACELLGAMHVDLAAGAVPAVALAAASDRTGIVAPFMTHGAGF
ncbi:CHAT domain-containing protein [Microbacterium aoyamense]|uniref:CHAT domain-containing protein n=1 Tax=Microbacterium aoyamense TaxID=344166 RepID=A0ABN2PTD2_9MICO|nr:CHAT domain-containing protein [Microbacterium aoyamense]